MKSTYQINSILSCGSFALAMTFCSIAFCQSNGFPADQKFYFLSDSNSVRNTIRSIVIFPQTEIPVGGTSVEIVTTFAFGNKKESVGLFFCKNTAGSQERRSVAAICVNGSEDSKTGYKTLEFISQEEGLFSSVRLNIVSVKNGEKTTITEIFSI